MCLESYLRLNHRWRQQCGYLRFYRNTRHLLSVPFYSVSCSIAASLLVELWPQFLCTLSPHLKLVSLVCPSRLSWSFLLHIICIWLSTQTAYLYTSLLDRGKILVKVTRWLLQACELMKIHLAKIYFKTIDEDTLIDDEQRLIERM